MKITAFILAKNRSRMLPAVLESVQGFPEVLVVVGDEESRRVASAWSGLHGPARVIEDHVNRSTGGFAGLRNRAMEHVRTEGAFFLDDDETMRPDAAEQLANYPVWGIVRRWHMADRRGMQWVDMEADWQTRLFPSTARWQRILHEHIRDLHRVTANKLPIFVYHWGWACEYALQSRIDSYIKVGGSAVAEDNAVDAWRNFRRRAVKPLPDGAWQSPPIPEPVLATWKESS